MRVELFAELEACLRDFSSAASVEIRENGGRVARGAAQKPLPHVWSDQHNFTRGVLAITAQSDQGLALAVERFGAPRPDRLEFVSRCFPFQRRRLAAQWMFQRR